MLNPGYAIVAFGVGAGIGLLHRLMKVRRYTQQFRSNIVPIQDVSLYGPSAVYANGPGSVDDNVCGLDTNWNQVGVVFAVPQLPNATAFGTLYENRIGEDCKYRLLRRNGSTTAVFTATDVCVECQGDSTGQTDLISDKSMIVSLTNNDFITIDNQMCRVQLDGGKYA